MVCEIGVFLRHRAWGAGLIVTGGISLNRRGVLVQRSANAEYAACQETQSGN